MRTKQIGVRIEESNAFELNELAEFIGCTKSAIVDRLLSNFFNEKKVIIDKLYSGEYSAEELNDMRKCMYNKYIDNDSDQDNPFKEYERDHYDVVEYR